MCSIGVTVLTEIFAHVITEPEVSGVGGVHLHATPSAPVTLCSQRSLDSPEHRGVESLPAVLK